MAGKHWTVREDAGFGDLDDLSQTPVFPGGRTDMAYAEGWQAQRDGQAAGTNPHATGTPEGNAWTNGWAASNLSPSRSSARQTNWLL